LALGLLLDFLSIEEKGLSNSLWFWWWCLWR